MVGKASRETHILYVVQLPKEDGLQQYISSVVAINNRVYAVTKLVS